jgi:multidrug efflux system membrane fusion protein
MRRAFPLTQLSIGTVQPMRWVAVKSQVDGVIKEIHFREGSMVKQGDLLVSLDSRPFENALRIARAEAANARAEAERAEADAIRYTQLSQTANVSKEEYAQFTTKRDTTAALVLAKEAAVANAELQLSYTKICAPIAGCAGQAGLHEGALVKANDASISLLTINQISPIEVAYTVPESRSGILRAALAAGPVSVRISTRTQPVGVLAGQLSFLDNAVDAATGMLTLKARLANEDQALWPGQFVDVETEMGADKDALLVPVGAVQIGQQGNQIFVVKADQTVDLRKVQVDRMSNGLALVSSGVSEGDTVVIDGQLRLVPGSRIEVRSLGDAANGANGNKDQAKQ